MEDSAYTNSVNALDVQCRVELFPNESISIQENQLMGISSSSIVGIFSTNTPVLYQFISILRLPLSFLPTLLRITYEGKEGGKEKFEGETGEQR